MPLAVRKAVGARRSLQVLERLDAKPPNIWYGGKKIESPVSHPHFRNALSNLAALYDSQWSHPQCLYQSPTTGEKVSRTFLIPRTVDELKSVTVAMKLRADSSFGMLGHMPDSLNRAMAAYASGAAYLGQEDARLGGNARKYYEFLRENDLSLIHTVTTPQADPFLTARIKEETQEGLIIRGCRSLATLPIADEMMVFPSTLRNGPLEDAPYAFGVAVPTHTKGLKFLIRESAHSPLARFEDQASVVVFEDVFVPWERVMLYRDIDRCNAAYSLTGALACVSHQSVVKSLAQTEFVMGLASLLADSIGAGTFQEQLAEVWINMETVRAFVRTAEEDAALDEYGMMRPAWEPLDACRQLYPRLYPRMTEILQQIGASGLVAMPTEADLGGPMAEEIRRYFHVAREQAHDRIALSRLAWDTCLLASHQVQHERFFSGDPANRAAELLSSHDRTPYMDRVRAFLELERPDVANGL